MKTALATLSALSLLATVACSASSNDGSGSSQNIVLGGAADSHDEAVLVDVMSGGMVARQCSGAVIAPRVVLTAAHCIDGYDGWTVTAPYANKKAITSTDGRVSDYKGNAKGAVNLAQHDVGLIVLPEAITLSKYPELAKGQIEDFQQVISIGRVKDGKSSSTGLYQSSPSQVQDGKDFGGAFDYVGAAFIQGADSGGPVELSIDGKHVIVAVNSTVAPYGDDNPTTYEYLARTDLVADFIAKTIASVPDADGGGADAGVDPGPAMSMPLVPWNGGAILTAPSLVTVTFPGDTQADKLEAWNDMIGTSNWWNTVRAGYCTTPDNCIGPASNGGHIRLKNPAAASYTDSVTGASTMQTFIAGLVSDKTLPAPTPNTLYMFYFPTTTTMTLDGAGSCTGFLGYHNSMTVNGVEFAYAIMPRCAAPAPNNTPQGELDGLTITASHELAEAATDPFLSKDPNNAYTGFGGTSDAWDWVVGGEVGDLCTDLYGLGNDVVTESGFKVQRIFNNLAAKAGHDPCLPSAAPATTPYFNIAPVAGDAFNVDLNVPFVLPVRGVSDGDPGAMKFAVQEITNGLGRGKNVVTATTDKTSLSVNEVGQLTMTMTANPDQGAAYLVITATKADGTSHYWPLVLVPNAPPAQADGGAPGPDGGN